MLRRILNGLTGGGRRRPAGGRPAGGRPAGGRPHGGAAGGNADIERGARQLLRGFMRKR